MTDVEPWAVAIEGDCQPIVLEHLQEIAVVVEVPEVCMVTAGEQGPPGPPGPPGMDAPGVSPVISADPDNRLTQGTDGGLHVLDDLTPDPLAYYILAKG